LSLEVDKLSDFVFLAQNSGNMATSRLGALVTAVVLVTACVTAEANGLSADYYAKTCPEYETIIYNYIHKLYHSPINNTVVSMIRWAFHDFFNVS
jgi:hypothetical protein